MQQVPLDNLELLDLMVLLEAQVHSVLLVQLVKLEVLVPLVNRDRLVLPGVLVKLEVQVQRELPGIPD